MSKNGGASPPFFFTHRLFIHRARRDVPWRVSTFHFSYCIHRDRTHPVSTRNFKDLFDIAEFYVILQNLFMEKT